MQLKHLEFHTSDGLDLPGLLYEPDQKTDKVAILLHGNGSSSIFYSPSFGATYAKYLNGKGIAYFPFNNRGAHIIKKLNKTVNGETQRLKYGCAYELIKECIFDIDGAIEFLKSLGYKTFYLIGASTGANKICVYNFYKPENPVSKYVFVGGGDDSGFTYSQMGKEKFEYVLKECQQKIKNGKGMDLAPEEWMGFYSYQSIFDQLNPDGNYNTFPYYEALNNLKISTKELFREFKSINKSTLVLYGENDEYCYGRVPEIVEKLKTTTSHLDKFTFEVLPECDHGFYGKEDVLVKTIAEWLAK